MRTSVRLIQHISATAKQPTVPFGRVPYRPKAQANAWWPSCTTAPAPQHPLVRVLDLHRERGVQEPAVARQPHQRQLHAQGHGRGDERVERLGQTQQVAEAYDSADGCRRAQALGGVSTSAMCRRVQCFGAPKGSHRLGRAPPAIAWQAGDTIVPRTPVQPVPTCDHLEGHDLAILIAVGQGSMGAVASAACWGRPQHTPNGRKLEQRIAVCTCTALLLG